MLRTSQLLGFRSNKELIAQTEHQPVERPLVAHKGWMHVAVFELTNNKLPIVRLCDLAKRLLRIVRFRMVHVWDITASLSSLPFPHQVIALNGSLL